MVNKKSKICPNCSQFYCINLGPSKVQTNLPLFLPCGHSMCENCILNIIKCMEPIECKVCRTDVEFKSSDVMTVVQNPTKLRDFFPVNMYMVGELTMYLMQNAPPTQNSTRDRDHFYDLKAVLKNESAQGECLECHATTTKMCQQCATILCVNCFNKSHKNFVIFRNHELQDIDTASQPNYCNIHKEKPLEYYCHDCKKAICMDCMMVGGEKSCKNHNVVSIEEVNGTFMEDLNNLYPQIDEVFRRLTKTAVDIGYLLLNYENDTGSATELMKIVASVDQHFSKLMSMVQKHKQEVINIIYNLKCSEKNSLEKAKIDVLNNIKKSKSIMKLIKVYSDSQKLKQANVSALLEDAQHILNTAWYLNKDDSDKEVLKINVNNDLCALINDYVHLEGNVKSVYKLYSTTELDESVEIPPAPKAPVLPPELPKDVRNSSKPKAEKEKDQKGRSLYTKVPKYRSKSGSVSSLNSVGSESSYKNYITQNDYQQPITHPDAPPFDAFSQQQLREGTQEIIYISHIVDPYNFYVQRACNQELVKQMFNEFRNAVSFTKPATNHISIGKTYLAFNKADNIWQRCRVIGVDRVDNNQQPRIDVFFFDFGSTATVSIDRLRLIPAARIQCPYALALKCSLANCVPKSGAWTSDDSILIQNIIDNKQAVIHIRRIISTSNIDFKVDCDVTTFEHGVSLAHALVFHDRAKMLNPMQRYPQITGLKEKPKLYNSHIDFRNDTPEPVYLTHVVSPDKFFVRKQHLNAVYDKLCDDLDQEYDVTSNAGTVYLPEIGMVCVVNVAKYRSEGAAGAAGAGAWARGVVLELPGRGRVRVQLPDTGLELLLPWTLLRYVTHKFTIIRAIATECHLAGVTPLNKRWAPGSVALLKNYEGNLLEVQVDDNRNWGHRNRGSIPVTVYDKTDPDNIVCINDEMIKHKYAIAIGLYVFNKNPVEEQVVTNKCPLAEPKSRTQTNKIKILKNQDATKINEVDLEAKDKGPIRLEAKVLHYQSPSLLYISLAHQQKTFNELFENMRKYYTQNNNLPEFRWKIGDRCCTICNQSKTWRRAVIMELENENAKVFYSDFACIETVPLSSLRELIKEFASFGDAVIKCHLSGIVPAVGEEWPSITKEFLKELLDVYKRVFITKIGNFKGKSMPVEIWVYHTVQGDALEPNKSEWRCLNTRIINQGLGIPDKTQIVVTPQNTETDEGDTLSFLNITGSVNEWLQLEPIPMVPVTKNDDVIQDFPSTSPETEDLSVQEKNVSNIMYISDWLPSEPLPEKSFEGVPTYIDNDGVIYLHHIAQEETIELIRKALALRYDCGDPKAKYSKWSIGEPCVALFYLDKKYYRAKVTDVNPKTSICQVQYVDFGNEEVCSFENIRKSVPMHQIPVQAHKCILSGIRPIGKQWDQTTLDYLHKSVVEKKCHVKVTGEVVNGIIPIELKYNTLVINDHLVEFEMAEYTDGSKALIKKFVPAAEEYYIEESNVTIASDSGPDYIVVDETNPAEPTLPSDDDLDSSLKGIDWNKIIDEENLSIDSHYVAYPKHTDAEFRCNINIINDIHTLELSVVHDEETSRVYESMFEDLQAESQGLPPLNGIFENKGCVAIFPEDGQWYRASILQFSEAKNRIKVKYIDYGNTEIIPLADTREIMDEWTKLPPATISAKLYGVQINPDVPISDITKEFSKVFLEDKLFNAKIISYEDSLPLVELRNDQDELIYNKLIEDNIFILKESI